MAKKIFSAAIILLVGGIVFWFLQNKNFQKDSAIDIVAKFERENFMRAIDAGKPFAQCDRGILAAVVPHHLIGGRYIADVFSQAKINQIKTVIVLGPNHKEKGDNEVFTTVSDWITAQGRLEADQIPIESLIQKKVAMEEKNIIAGDHSIGNILPFVAYYLPEAKIVPIIVKHNISDEKEDMLLRWLMENIDDKTLVIGSADFSHYLSVTEANEKDVEMKKMIEGKKYTQIEKLNNDYVDSPQTLLTILKLAETRNATKSLIRSQNSYDVLGVDLTNTTSHFEIVFCR